MNNIFLEKPYPNVVEKLLPDPFLKNQNSAYLRINSLKCYTSVFIVWQVECYWKYIKTKLQTTCFHFILSFFKKIKRGLELVSLPHFRHNFWRKMSLLLYSINCLNCHILNCHYFMRYSAICVLALFVNQVVTSSISRLALFF